MVSEFVNGGDPVSTKNTHPAEVAIERGLNYLDMAPAYGSGEMRKGICQDHRLLLKKRKGIHDYQNQQFYRCQKQAVSRDL
jgi:hypothetical protein